MYTRNIKLSYPSLKCTAWLCILLGFKMYDHKLFSKPIASILINDKYKLNKLGFDNISNEKNTLIRFLNPRFVFWWKVSVGTMGSKTRAGLRFSKLKIVFYITSKVHVHVNWY